MNNLISLSQKLLFNVKVGESTKEILAELREWSLEDLKQELTDDQHKKAFWINIYNAFTQHFLGKRPDIMASRITRKEHFREKKIFIAGEAFSLDEIEHGILRKSRIWWSLGLLGKPFAGAREKALRVSELDFRIHFALNCGGESCPAIRFYEPEKIDYQLELAGHSFVVNESRLIAAENKVRLSRIFQWYKFDFGGRKGILKLLRKYQVIPENASPRFTYAEYNWSPDVQPFAE